MSHLANKEEEAMVPPLSNCSAKLVIFFILYKYKVQSLLIEVLFD